MIRNWLLDLDNTLYPANSGLFALIDQRIDAFLEQHLGLSPTQIPLLRRRYRERYGVTLAGLLRHHDVDPGVYQDYVHDLPLEQFIAPDPQLTAALAQLPGRRVIFTNGSANHARAVLSRLGVNGEIDAIYDIAYMDYVPKPFAHGYRKLLREWGEAAARCCLVDDLPANLDTAVRLGMTTVLVGDEPRSPHHHVRRAGELASLLPLGLENRP